MSEFEHFGTGIRRSSWETWRSFCRGTMMATSVIGLVALTDDAAKAQEYYGPGAWTGLVCAEKEQINEIVQITRLDPKIEWQTIVALLSQGSPNPVCNYVDGMIHNGLELQERIEIKHETFQIVALTHYVYNPANVAVANVFVFFGIAKIVEEAKN